MSLVVLAGAALVVTVRNLFHAALLLIISFFGVVGLYVLLDAGFFAAAQFLVYIGAISILIIFAVMLTRGVVMQQRANSQWPAALVVSVIVFAVMAALLGPVAFTAGNRQFGAVAWVDAGAPVPPIPAGYLTSLGRAFVDVNQYAVPFLLMGVLLLIAMVGAIWVARERYAAEVVEERAEAAQEPAQPAPVQPRLPLMENETAGGPDHG